MATRRACMDDGTALAFDHGAQYFTARSDAFRREVADWQAHGWVAPWSAQLAEWDGQALRAKGDPGPMRFVGTPGMSALTRALSDSLPLTTAQRATALEPQHGHWEVATEDGAILTTHRVVLALPAPQAAALLPATHPFQAESAAVSMAPCWAVMLHADVDCAFDGLFVNAGPLSWIARNHAKPGRPEAPCWVLHGSAEWSRAHVEADPAWVGAALVEALTTVVGTRPRVHTMQAHRWRYALADAPLEAGALWDAEASLGVCGDWLAGSRVEGAWTSGVALARQMLG
jgi:hypothetical protein